MREKQKRAWAEVGRLSGVVMLLGAGLALACIDPAAGRPPADASGQTSAAGEATEAPESAKSDDAANKGVPHAFTHTSKQLLEELEIGWNLGNALDAPDSETAWGNPTITPELLRAVKAAGFRMVRIPVTWTKHMGPGPGYVIDEKWLARVREVVGYARDAGLTAIINVHHDGADGFTEVEWLTLNDAAGKTTPENDELVRARFVTVWTQIAKGFSDFGEELLFESMNEIHDGYGQPDPRHIEFINRLNQTFVRLVRASGGKNAERHLVVPGYNTNIDHTLAGFRLPEDSTKERLILSVHFYDPYLFALMAEKHTWGAASPGRDDWGQEDHVVKQFDAMKAKFIDRGVPVIIGEYGATYQKGYEDYRRYYMEYVTRAAVERGMVPVYWDNGGQNSGAENFGLFDRKSGAVLQQGMLDAMIRATGEGSLGAIALPRPSN